MSGAGYVGLVTGTCLAELGHAVVCLETDPVRLSMLQRGELPIHEPGLGDAINRLTRTGRLRFADDYAAAVPECDFAFIAVSTPAGPDGRADTSFVFAAARSIIEHARPGLIVVVKSTVPVGTADDIAQLIGRAGRADVDVVANPEFLREGSAIRDFAAPDRIVIGASDPAAGRAVAQLYASLDAPVMLCSPRSAELAKYAANALLATRISFINEMSVICDALQADVEEVARIVGADRRIGPAFLKAGLGWGGSCFPKDVRALAASAADRNCPADMLDAVLNVNARQREGAFHRIRSAVGTSDGAVVGVLGLAFKPDTDDLRGSPALDIIGRLLEEGIQVRAHDPVAMPKARAILPNIHYCDDAYEVTRGSDALLLATEWPEYLLLDWARVHTLMRGRVIFDGRNALDREMLSGLGYTYLAFGRTAPPWTNGQIPANGDVPKRGMSMEGAACASLVSDHDGAVPAAGRRSATEEWRRDWEADQVR
jgi:UDPglucose 6-dehydrogenase